MLKNEKSTNRNDHQNRKTEVFCNKNQKTDLKNSQNRKTENPIAPLIIDCVTTNLNDGGQGVPNKFIQGGSAPRSNPLPFKIPFFTRKVPLSHTLFGTLHPF